MKKIKDFLNNLLPNDKLKHSFWGMFIFIIAILIRDYFDLNQYMPLITICIAAFLNEVYDFFKENSTGFDIIDFLFTILYPLILTFLIF